MALIRWLLNYSQDHYEKHLRGLVYATGKEEFFMDTFRIVKEV